MERKIDDTTSRKINVLRFILSVLVVFIHNDRSMSDSYRINNVGNFFQNFISEGLAMGAVPLFFYISAYLQCIKDYNYKTLLSKKSKSIFIPYLLWFFINLAIYSGLYLLCNNTFGYKISEEEGLFYLNYNLLDWCKLFTGYGNELTNPYIPQFWFLRELLVIAIISPLIKLCIDKKPIMTMIIVMIGYLANIKLLSFNYRFMVALFYSCLGYFSVKKDFNLFDFIDDVSFIILLPVFVACFIIIQYVKFIFIIETVMIFVAFLILIKISQLFLSGRRYTVLSKLSSYSFFIYECHMPIVIKAITSIWLFFIPTTNTFLCLLEYFGVSFLVITFCLLFGIILKKIIPKFYYLLNGGR